MTVLKALLIMGMGFVCWGVLILIAWLAVH